MGYSELSPNKDKSKVESISFTDSFKEYCPIFMSYGMSYDEFWYDDVCKARYYLKAYKQKLKQKDMELWEQGMYIYELLLEVAPILRPFSKAEPLPYTEKPHHMLIEEQKDEEKQKELSEQQKETERLKAQIWLNNFVRMMKKKK